MSDEIIWQVINQQFCAFKLKTTKEQNFCRNEYNVSGLCTRQSCPLANARYATVKNVDGKLYLYMKTAERAHTPAKLWQRIKLSKNYNKALKQVDDNLLYWNKFLIHKCKQRLTRLTQVAIMERRLALKENEREYVGVKKKVKRREQTRERKALIAAKIEKNIEQELLDRLKSGAYGDNPLNVDSKIWSKILNNMEEEGEGVEDEEEDEDEESESEGEIEYVEEEDDEELVDVEDLEKWLGDSDASEAEEDSDSDSEDEEEDKKRKKTDTRNVKRRPRIEIEYENETEANQRVSA